MSGTKLGIEGGCSEGSEKGGGGDCGEGDGANGDGGGEGDGGDGGDGGLGGGGLGEGGGGEGDGDEASVGRPTRGEEEPNVWLRRSLPSAATLSFEPPKSAWARSVPFSSIASFA